MMNVSTLTVLLVCAILECAHSAAVERGWEGFSPRSKRSTLNRFSVVENWNSVCEEVCSIGFGGPGCGVGCVQTPLGSNFISKIIALREICPALCENYLGITKCNCAASSLNPDIISARNSLCSATCSWKMPLNGCSECGTTTVETTEYTQTTVDETTDDYFTTNTTDDYITTTTTHDESPTTDEHSTDEEDTTTEEYSPTEVDITDPNEDDSTTVEEPTTTTTTSTTTTTQPTTTTTKTTTTATTTPNWESMCEALCRNGEGGSLCNCDIPPFF